MYNGCHEESTKIQTVKKPHQLTPKNTNTNSNPKSPQNNLHIKNQNCTN